MVVALAVGPYVGGGLGSAFAGAKAWLGIQGTVGAAVFAGFAVGAEGAVAVVACAVAAVAVVAFGRRLLGGVTGDVLGAAGILGETVGLVVATASW
jgi:adenosylcobinamide-GDP ribazoletransferase